MSGGERHRIALARAFLRDAPVLILDEPTRSIDVKNEREVMEALNRLIRGRTSFIIAHRLDTLAGCDLRLEVAGGRIRAVNVRSDVTTQKILIGGRSERPQAAEEA